MKHFASHYLFLPEVGFIRQQVVEVTAEGTVRAIFPLTEEVESVEWMPGVIALLSAAQVEDLKNTGMVFKTIPVFQINHPVVLNQSPLCFKKTFNGFCGSGEALFPVLFYPFDFISMQPVGGTRHRLLR
jgi:hypothetical protein